MALNSFTVPAAGVKLVVLADAESRQVMRWENRKPTDNPALDDDGNQIHRITDIPALWQGEQTTIAVQSSEAFTLPAGKVLAAGKGCSLQVRASSDRDSTFAEMRLTLRIGELQQVADFSEQLAR
ncbi:hypothetical protein HMPREF2860_09585 [Corynebacterium sp. HMSC064E10]|uniref:hypothetical protein n=1 Tax=Corynebacterium sp. HMSC064E10 TaxID=1739364 RepID=UPI0008A524D7|nr:hypothetical protein [Corynebacterium sp. HMSC064E10]OFR94309.1 hypothetical protein HMPREF2860_09585 [Corynebacterium sp. HMSC064E10]